MQLSPITLNDLLERTKDYHCAGVGHFAWLFENWERARHFTRGFQRRLVSGEVSFHSLEGASRLEADQPITKGVFLKLFGLRLEQVRKSMANQGDRAHVLVLFEDASMASHLMLLSGVGTLPNASSLISWHALRQREQQREIATDEALHWKVRAMQKKEEVEELKAHIARLERQLDEARAHTNRSSALFCPHRPLGKRVMVRLAVERVLERTLKGIKVTYVTQDWFPRNQVDFQEEEGFLDVPIWLADDKHITGNSRLSKPPPPQPRATPMEHEEEPP